MFMLITIFCDCALCIDYNKRILIKSEGIDEDRKEIYEIEIEK